jgi:hypothetical protein
LEGTGGNRFGIGAKVIVYSGDKVFYHEQIPSRGWLSSVDFLMHVGLGPTANIDSVSVHWTGGKIQLVRSVKVNQTIIVKEQDAQLTPVIEKRHAPDVTPLLLSVEQNILFKHKENDFVAFSSERLIPHMISTQGPGISVGDVNGDKLEDFFVGGAAGQSGKVFIHDTNGSFRPSVQPAIEADSSAEDIDAVFIDVDENTTLDLVVVSGGQEFRNNNKNLAVRLYLNDGKGTFHKDTKLLPGFFLNASCIRPADIDKDGDTDLFIGGRVLPGRYGIDPQSYLLINSGKGVFQDATLRFFPSIKSGSLGLVTDAVWCDVNQDDRVDLVVSGEWMPITFMVQNESGVFEDMTAEYGLSTTNGWWNTIAAHDFDKDGDVDFVAGNRLIQGFVQATKNR